MNHDSTQPTWLKATGPFLSLLSPLQSAGKSGQFSLSEVTAGHPPCPYMALFKPSVPLTEPVPHGLSVSLSFQSTCQMKTHEAWLLTHLFHSKASQSWWPPAVPAPPPLPGSQAPRTWPCKPSQSNTPSQLLMPHHLTPSTPQPLPPFSSHLLPKSSPLFGLRGPRLSSCSVCLLASQSASGTLLATASRGPLTPPLAIFSLPLLPSKTSGTIYTQMTPKFLRQEWSSELKTCKALPTGTFARMSLHHLKLHMSPNELNIIPAHLHPGLTMGRHLPFLTSKLLIKPTLLLGMPSTLLVYLENVYLPMSLPFEKMLERCH
nr:uncharacterized protein LOC123860835 [Mirounga angustirostris]